MSRSQLEQEKKPLDSFVWVNEITGEVTLPPGEETTLAASGEKHPVMSGSSPGGTQCVPVAAHRPASPGTPEADPRAGNVFLPDSAVPRMLCPPGGALPVQQQQQHHHHHHHHHRHLGASPSLTVMPPASPSPPWALPGKLRNALTGNNRFSF
ncbi:uncharacterized protein C3orf86 homolog [Arvicola amphibius]|uniref:uncharacterized protein C3orf86 homolog n=1 Tax=Arvicola amphibius TaxID=1047088 RepID=UPI0018E31034|nr:uncharacterized protein C3orf86 homolog [Arvicola amphibius]